jgi:hypothetical protein
MAPWLCTREDVKHALDSRETSRNNRQVDAAVASATLSIEGMLHRKFYPQLATRYKDWPDTRQVGARPWRIWLDEDELISVLTLTSGGTVITPGDYFLEPANDGPPYDRIELDRSGSATFGGGSTPQRSVGILGLWGFDNEEESVGQLTATLGASDTATASISWTTARVGVGDLLRIDSERMIITDRSMVDSGQNLQTPMTAAASNVTAAVTSGTGFGIDEVLLLESERMLVVDIAGNNLTVKRAWDGSPLAAHTSSDVYTLTGVELDRAAAGTTLAAHSSSATIYRYKPPPLLRTLAVAESMNILLQEGSGYARVVGSGESQREASGRGLRELREQALTVYGRQARKRAV